MTGANFLFVAIGSAALLGGLGLLARAVAGGAGEPARTAMLIGGMMLAAFGALLAGFAIVFTTAGPLDLRARLR